MSHQINPISPIINSDELMEIRTNKNLVLVDARSGKNAKSDYAEKHLDGAKHIDLNLQLSHIKDAANGGRHPLPEVSDFVKTLSELGISKDSHVVVYDDVNGANSGNH